jgi:hypothetical protein
MITFSGPAQVQVYRAITLKHGLILYAKTRMKPNSAWTPTAMLKAAGQITGQRYRRGAYHAAALDLDRWIKENQDAQ